MKYSFFAPAAAGKKASGIRPAAVLLILALIAAMLLSACGSSDPEPTTATAADATQETAVKVLPTFESVRPDSDGLLHHDSILNILLIGEDYSLSGEFGRSDALMVLSIDTAHDELKLTSIQRDTYVYIPGCGDDKINTAYALGGADLAVRTVEENYGIKVDRYAVCDYDAFRRIISILGGVDMELDLEEIKYINAQIDVNHQLDRTSYITYDRAKELQTIRLDGYQALWYVRDRGEENLGGNPEYSFSGDDWDRTERQRKLIASIVSHLREEATLDDLVKIVNDIGPLIKTDLKKTDILFLSNHLDTYVGYEVRMTKMPSEGTWRYAHTDDGMSVIAVDDWDQAQRDIAAFIYGDLVTFD